MYKENNAMTIPGTQAPVAESNLNLSYEVPQAEATPDEAAEFADLQRNAIEDIAAEFNPQADEEFTPEELAEGEPTEKPAEPSEASAEQPAEEPAIAKGMERLVAREVALQAKEAAFQAREARVQALEQELGTLRQKQPAQDIYEKFGHSPTEAVKALGQDPETVVRLMIAEQLEAKGQEVPPQLKEFVKDAQRERRIKELEHREVQRQRDAAMQAEFNAVQLGAHEYVRTFAGEATDAKAATAMGSREPAKSMPVLAKLAKADAAYAHSEIMEEIAKDARARMAAEPNGQPLTYEEAAKRVEARLSKLNALISVAPASTPTTQAARTLKTVPPTNKPPARPLKPWEKKGDDEMARALADAEREFHRVEAVNKRRG